MKNVTPNCYVPYSYDNEDTQSYVSGWNTTIDNITGTTPDEFTYMRSDELDGYPFIGRHAVYRGGGYTVKLSGTRTENLATVQKLQDELWLDHHTRAVFVQFGSYNAYVNLFSSVTLLMEFLPTGKFAQISTYQIIQNRHQGHIITKVSEMCKFVFYAVWE